MSLLNLVNVLIITVLFLVVRKDIVFIIRYKIEARKYRGYMFWGEISVDKTSYRNKNKLYCTAPFGRKFSIYDNDRIDIFVSNMWHECTIINNVVTVSLQLDEMMYKEVVLDLIEAEGLKIRIK